MVRGFVPLHLSQVLAIFCQSVTCYSGNAGLVPWSLQLFQTYSVFTPPVIVLLQCCSYLSWDRRLMMLHNVAAGLCYLHGRSHVHGEVQTQYP